MQGIFKAIKTRVFASLDPEIFETLAIASFYNREKRQIKDLRTTY